MSDVTPIDKSKSDSASTVATEISYCPHLDLYHYKKADGTDYMFDTEQLTKSLEVLMKQGDPRQAEFMAVLTGLGRRYPHKVVSFDETGKCCLRDLPAAVISDDEADAPKKA